MIYEDGVVDFVIFVHEEKVMNLSAQIDALLKSCSQEEKKALAAFDPAFASEIGVSSKPTWNLPINATPHYKRDTNAGVGAFVSAQALG